MLSFIRSQSQSQLQVEKFPEPEPACVARASFRKKIHGAAQKQAGSETLAVAIVRKDFLSFLNIFFGWS